MNVSVERNLFVKFHKDGGEECFSLKSKYTEFVVESSLNYNTQEKEKGGCINKRFISLNRKTKGNVYVI